MAPPRIPGRTVAAPWPQLGRNLAATWPHLGRTVAATWPQLGRDLAATWPQLGRNLAATWPQLGHNLAATSPHLRRTFAAPSPHLRRTLAASWPHLGRRRDPSTQTSKTVRKIIRMSADNQATDTCTSTDTCTHQQNNKPEYMLKHKEVERTKVHRSTTKHILTHNICFKRHNAGSMPVVTRGPPTPLAKPSHRGTDEHDL